jgi:hypothetical protein
VVTCKHYGNYTLQNVYSILETSKTLLLQRTYTQPQIKHEILPQGLGNRTELNIKTHVVHYQSQMFLEKVSEEGKTYRITVTVHRYILYVNEVVGSLAFRPQLRTAATKKRGATGCYSG